MNHPLSQTCTTSGFIQSGDATRNGLVSKLQELESLIIATQDKIAKIKAVLELFPDPMNNAYIQTSTSGSLGPALWAGTIPSK